MTYLKYDNCFADTCAEYGCGNAPNDTIYRYTAMSNALNKTNGRYAHERSDISYPFDVRRTDAHSSLCILLRAVQPRADPVLDV